MLKTLLSGLVIMAASMGAHAASTPEGTVDELFDAMRAGSGDDIRALVVADARLDRLQPDGSLRQGSFERWISWVDEQNEGDADEKIFGVQTLSMSAELATVWAPFTIAYKGELVGCGVNQFTLGKTAEGWRVLYGIDMPSELDCTTYPDQFKDD